jgi:hypothetical protein
MKKVTLMIVSDTDHQLLGGTVKTIIPVTMKMMSMMKVYLNRRKKIKTMRATER